MLSFFPRGVLDEILSLTESVSEGFPSYSFINKALQIKIPKKSAVETGKPVKTQKEVRRYKKIQQSRSDNSPGDSCCVRQYKDV